MISNLTFLLFGTLLAATPCEDLKSLAFPDATVTLAELRPVGAPVPTAPAPNPPPAEPAPLGGDIALGRGSSGPAGPAGGPVPSFCRMAGVLKPSKDSNINFEVWLPLPAAWNGKFEAVGNGGWAGSMQGYPAMEAGVRRGYATAGTDTGHNASDGPSGAFALGHPEKVIDFAYRAVHEMTVKAKAVIQAFYGRAPTFSYFNGCSTGGRQALMSAQRYPEDFDGIIAGAPANYQTHLHAADMDRGIQIRKDPANLLTRAQTSFLNQAVLNACDANDGVRDGILDDPRQCKFDPGTLQCKAGASENCFTPNQVAAIRRAYAPTKTKDGRLIFPGYQPGSETGWTVIRSGGAPGALEMDTFRYLTHQDANWDWRTFDLDRDVALADKRVGFINAIDPDLTKFKQRGGKLLIYHGWNDTAIPTENSVNYYTSVLEKMGKNQDDWLRLFMIPGAGHCRGGPGPNEFDGLAVMERWRESGIAPDRIIGANTAAGLTRPLCPYPQIAQYDGKGDPKDAASFACSMPRAK